MQPPFESSFASKGDLINAVQAHARGQGYAVVIQKSNPKKKEFWLACDRGGEPRPSKSTGKRVSSTRKCGCSFRVYCSQKSDELWYLTVLNQDHNHEPSINLSCHPKHRQLCNENLEQIKELTAANVKPKHIIATLRASGDAPYITNRDVYNAIAKEKRDELNGRTPIQALCDKLEESEEYNFRVDLDENNKVTRLAIANRELLALAEKYFNVVLLDCTYKTNKNKMPLLHIVGIAPTGDNFTIGVVFLSSEVEEDYIWALQVFRDMMGNRSPNVFATDRELALLNALEAVFPGTPTLLCQWHINKNITSKCKRHFDTNAEFETFLKDWNTLCRSETEQEYDLLMEQFRQSLATKPECLAYLDSTWLPYCRKFVRCWADDAQHFGTLTTSRIKGAHARLKSYLSVSTSNLYSAFKSIEIAWKNEVIEVQSRISADRVQKLVGFRYALYDNVHNKISRYALRKLLEQEKEVPADDVCTLRFQSVWGIPCKHIINDRLQRGEYLQVGDFSSQWHLDDYDEAEPTQPIAPLTQIDALTDTLRQQPPHVQQAIMNQLNILLFVDENNKESI